MCTEDLQLKLPLYCKFTVRLMRPVIAHSGPKTSQCLRRPVSTTAARCKLSSPSPFISGLTAACSTCPAATTLPSTRSVSVYSTTCATRTSCHAHLASRQIDGRFLLPTTLSSHDQCGIHHGVMVTYLHDFFAAVAAALLAVATASLCNRPSSQRQARHNCSHHWPRCALFLARSAVT